MPTATTSPAELDAVLTVLAHHARDLAALGPVRVAAGAVTLEVGPSGAAPAAPAPPVGALGSSVGDVPAAPAAPAPPASPTHPAPVPAPAARPDEGPTVRASTVGVFYRASEPGAAPFVAEGDTVAVGQQIGIVEAMKLMIPLESDRAGTVEEILVCDGDAVEHGQPLLRLSARGA